jgi:hypothetical protein
MKKKELQEKLNELLVGKSAYYNASLCKVINEHLSDLEIDNTQGDYFTCYDNYTFTISWKQKRLVSFDVKRKRDETHEWVVKQVIVEDDFVDYETSMKRIRESYGKDIARFNEWRYNDNTLETLKETLKSVRVFSKTLTKNEEMRLISDLARHYWLVDEALESEK